MKRKLALSMLVACMLGSSAYAQEKSGVFIGANVGVSFLNAKNLGNIADPLGAGFGLGYDGKENEISIAAGAKVGYSRFFGSLFGVRGYLGYDYTGSRKIANISDPMANMAFDIPLGKASIAFHEISVNADALLNFVNTENLSFGVFAGFGLGYSIATLSNKDIKDFFQSKFDYNGFVLPIRVGLSTTIAKRHRIEITGKFATFRTEYTAKETNVQPNAVGTAAGMNTLLAAMGKTSMFTTKDGVGVSPYTITIGYSFIF